MKLKNILILVLFFLFLGCSQYRIKTQKVSCETALKESEEVTKHYYMKCVDQQLIIIELENRLRGANIEIHNLYRMLEKYTDPI